MLLSLLLVATLSESFPFLSDGTDGSFAEEDKSKTISAIIIVVTAVTCMDWTVNVNGTQVATGATLSTLHPELFNRGSAAPPYSVTYI